jgi:hypothetical protein
VRGPSAWVVSLYIFRNARVNTSSVTDDSPGTWILKVIGVPLEGLGKGAEMIISDVIVGVKVGVMVGVLVWVKVLVGVPVKVAVGVLVLE